MEPPRYRVALNVPKLLAAYGTPADIHRDLTRFGLPVASVAAIQKWRERESIGGEWLAVLSLLSVELGLPPFDIQEYVTRETITGNEQSAPSAAGMDAGAAQ